MEGQFQKCFWTVRNPGRLSASTSLPGDPHLAPPGFVPHAEFRPLGLSRSASDPSTADFADGGAGGARPGVVDRAGGHELAMATRRETGCGRTRATIWLAPGARFGRTAQWRRRSTVRHHHGPPPGRPNETGRTGVEGRGDHRPGLVGLQFNSMAFHPDGSMLATSSRMAPRNSTA